MTFRRKKAYCALGPPGGPKLLWTFDNAGLGYSGPAIVGNRLFTLGAYAGKEYVYAIDASTGGELWSAEIGPVLTNGWGDGPRSTPTVDGTRLYALGAQGILICAEVANGKKVWSVDFQNELGGTLPGWGYTESPLVDGDKVVCTPGGAQGSLAALDKQTGKVIWRSTSLKDSAAYSSIIVAEVGGLRQYVQMTSRGVERRCGERRTPALAERPRAQFHRRHSHAHLPRRLCLRDFRIRRWLRAP